MQDVELESRQSTYMGDVLNLYFLAKFQALPKRLYHLPYSFPVKTIQLLLLTSIFFKEGNLRIFKGSKILDEEKKKGGYCS